MIPSSSPAEPYSRGRRDLRPLVFADPDRDRVRKDELIARIDSTLLSQEVRAVSASLDKSRAELADAQDSFERQQSLYNQGLSPESDFSTALSRLRTAQASEELARVNLERARRNLAYTEIRSPIDGIVVDRNKHHLKHADWPGNIREIRNTLERAAIL